MAGSCEYDNEHLESLKGWNFLSSWATVRFSRRSLLRWINRLLSQSVI